MSRIYSLIFENVSISAAQDLFEVAPASNKPVAIHGWTLSNVGGTADAGDAAEELLRLEIIRGFTTVGSAGTAGAANTNMNPLNPGDPAPSFGARTNDTTVATGGTAVNIFADGWNVRIPYQMYFTPETRPVCTSSETRIVVRLVGAPADAVSCSGTIFVEELG